MDAFNFIVISFGVMFTVLAYYNAPTESTFKQALVGIWTACAFALFSAYILKSAHADWLTYTEVFIGVEQPNMEVSPQCAKGKGDTKLTSNLGLEQGIWSKDNTHFYIKYQHHSCAIGYDDRVTDSIGVGVKYRMDWR